MIQLTGLSGKRVLVTAGASGIGLSIAASFAMAGAKVCVCDNDATAVAGLDDDHADLHACVTDVSQAGQVEDLCSRYILVFRTGSLHLRAGDWSGW